MHYIEVRTTASPSDDVCERVKASLGKAIAVTRTPRCLIGHTAGANDHLIEKTLTDRGIDLKSAFPLFDRQDAFV